MRLVIAVDGDLLVPPEALRGMAGQREEIARVAAGLGTCCARATRPPHRARQCAADRLHAAALRSRQPRHAPAARSTSAGQTRKGPPATCLQQALQNWFAEHGLEAQVASVVTQVVVDVAQAAAEPLRGIGPFYDPDKARAYATSRNWRFVLMPGQGYRRAVPSLKPQAVVELKTIRSASRKGRWWCARAAGAFRCGPGRAARAWAWRSWWI